MCFDYASPETSPSAGQPTVPPPITKKSRRRIFAIVGIVAVAEVALALIFVFLVPPSAEATIPLSYNYTPGEKMTYNVTVTATDATGKNASLTETMSMDILGFDGENYTISQTMTVSMPAGSPMTFNFTEKMNKTGYATYANGTSGNLQAYSVFSPVGSIWQKDNATVGETWQVPMSLGNSAYSRFYGNLTLKFGDIQDITVSAGMYRVFRIDVSGINLSVVISPPPPANRSIFENFNVTGQMYLEYGTCRLVESDLQESISILQEAQTSTQNMTMHTELVKHTLH